MKPLWRHTRSSDGGRGPAARSRLAGYARPGAAGRRPGGAAAAMVRCGAESRPLRVVAGVGGAGGVRRAGSLRLDLAACAVLGSSYWRGGGPAGGRQAGGRGGGRRSGRGRPRHWRAGGLIKRADRSAQTGDGLGAKHAALRPEADEGREALARLRRPQVASGAPCPAEWRTAWPGDSRKSMRLASMHAAWTAAAPGTAVLLAAALD